MYVIVEAGESSVSLISERFVFEFDIRNGEMVGRLHSYMQHTRKRRTSRTWQLAAVWERMQDVTRRSPYMLAEMPNPGPAIREQAIKQIQRAAQSIKVE